MVERRHSSTGLKWGPLFERSERDAAIGQLMRAAFHPGLLAHHFSRACRDGKTGTGTVAAQPKPA